MLNPDNAFLKPLHNWPVQSLTLDQPRQVFFLWFICDLLTLMTTVRLLEPGADSQTKDLNPHGVQHRLFRETATKFDLHLAKGFHWKHCARAWKFGSIGNRSKNGCGMFWDDSRIRHQELYILRIGEFLGGIPNITQPICHWGGNSHPKYLGEKQAFLTLLGQFLERIPLIILGEKHILLPVLFMSTSPWNEK